MTNNLQQPDVIEVKTKPGSISTEFQRFLSDIEDLVAQATSLTGDDLARVKKVLQERINTAKASLEELSYSVAQRARNGAIAADNYVHEQPWAAVGAGATIGLLVGLLISRRN